MFFYDKQGYFPQLQKPNSQNNKLNQKLRIKSKKNKIDKIDKIDINSIKSKSSEESSSSNKKMHNKSSNTDITTSQQSLFHTIVDSDKFITDPTLNVK